MNFLEICRRLTQETGTISGDNVPSSTVGQIGRLKKIVDKAVTAYNDIQDKHEDWLWMQAQFTGVITSPTTTYTGASFGLTRHRKWIRDEHTVTMYATATGVADESELTFLSYRAFLRQYDRGVQTPNRPMNYTITPANEIRLGPVPDTDYMLRGLYQKSNQNLGSTGTAADNTEIPELPFDYHMIIVWDALLTVGEYDVAGPTQTRAQRQRQDLWVPLVRTQRPSPCT